MKPTYRILDLETRSRCDLKTAGAWRYAEDPSTLVINFATKIVGDEYSCDLWHYGDHMPDWVQSREWESGVIMEAHNAFFEASIWTNFFVKKLGWPEIPTQYWACTAARAAMCALPRALDKVGEALNLPKKKDEVGKKVMLQLARPRGIRPPVNDYYEGEWETVTKARDQYQDWFDDAMDEQESRNYESKSVLFREWEIDPDGTIVRWYTPETDPEKYAALDSYVIDDVLSEECLSETIPDLPDSEREVWLLDQEINKHGVYIDLPSVELAIKVVEDYTQELNAELAEITAGFVTSIGQIANIKVWSAANGVKLPNVTADVIDNVLSSSATLPANVRRVLEIRRSLGKASIKKLYAMRERTSLDGRCRDIMMYHGASTGRPTGRGLQVLNLPRPLWKDYTNEEAFKLLGSSSWQVLRDRYGEPLDAISSMLRGFISAPDGYDLIVADYASIEARVVAWLADQQDALDVFRNGEDIYVYMAMEIYKKQAHDVTDAERQLGKQAILGLGYGMSAAKFVITCAGYGIEITQDFAQKVVDIYRSKYEKIKQYWYDTEKAAIEAVLTGRPISCGHVTWQMHGKFLTAILPSGRRLYYYGPTYQDAETAWGAIRKQLHFWAPNPVSKAWQLESTYGARLVENLSQAVSRDLMYSGALKAVQAGYVVTNFIYDELVCEIPEDFGSLEEYCDILCQVPAWGYDIPVKAAGYRSKRYKK